MFEEAGTISLLSYCIPLQLLSSSYPCPPLAPALLLIQPYSPSALLLPNFRLGMFGQVGPFWGKKKIACWHQPKGNSVSNETEQNVASIVKFWHYFFYLYVTRILKIWTCVFHPIWVKVDTGVSWGKNNLECVWNGCGYFLTDLPKPTDSESFYLCFSYNF